MAFHGTVGAMSGSVLNTDGSPTPGVNVRTLTVTGSVHISGSLDLGGAAVSHVYDEDNMASDSNSGLATQQSIKAYVDSQVTAQDLDVTSDSGTISIDLDSETLTIAGTTGEIETSATGNTVTVGLPNNVTIGGDLTVGGNDIKSSDGTTAITMESDGSAVTIAGTLRTNNFIDIKESNQRAELYLRRYDSGGLVDNEQLGILWFGGSENDSDWGYPAAIQARLAEDFVEGNSEGCELEFYTTPVGTHGTNRTMVLDPSGNLQIDGSIQVDGNVIKASDGGSTITMDASDNVTIGGNIQVGGNIIKASDGGSTITMDTNDNVTIGKDLTVSGGDIYANSTNARASVFLTRNDTDNLVSGEEVGFLSFRGRENGGTIHQFGGIVMETNEAFQQGSTHGSKLKFYITPDGNNSNALGMTLRADKTLEIKGNIIRASDGGATITMDTSDNVTIGGDLTIGGNDIKSSDGVTAISMSADGTEVIFTDKIRTNNFIDIKETDARAELYLRRYDSGGLTDNEDLGAIIFGGSENNSNWGYPAAIMAKLTQNFVEGSSEGCELEFYTTPDGGHPRQCTMVLDPSGNLQIDGSIQVDGNVIKASDGGSTITMDTSDNVTIGGNVTSNSGNFYAATGNALGLYAPGDAIIKLATDGGASNFFRVRNTESEDVFRVSENTGATTIQNFLGTDGIDGAASLRLRRDDSGGIISGDPLGIIYFQATEDGTVNATAEMRAVTTETYQKSTAEGTRLEFWTTPNGGSSRELRMIIDDDGKVGIGNAITNPQAKIHSDSTAGGSLGLSRTDSNIGAGEHIGKIRFFASEDSGTNYTTLGEILVDASQNSMDLSSDCPTELKISLVPDGSATTAQVMNLTGGARLGINKATPAGVADSGGEGTGMVHIYSTGWPGLVVEGDDHSIIELAGTAGNEISMRFSQGSSNAWTIGMDNTPNTHDDGFSIKSTQNGTPDFYVHTDGDIEGTFWSQDFVLKMYRSASDTGYVAQALMPISSDTGDFDPRTHGVRNGDSGLMSDFSDSDAVISNVYQLSMSSVIVPHDIEILGFHYMNAGELVPKTNGNGTPTDSYYRLYWSKSSESASDDESDWNFGSEDYIGLGSDIANNNLAPGNVLTVDITGESNRTFTAGDKLALHISWYATSGTNQWFKWDYDGSNMYSADAGYHYAKVTLFGKKTGGTTITGR